MKKRIFFQVLLLCILQNCYSQDVNQNVIGSAGGSAQSENISLEWTLGELAVETITTAKNLYTQGFHQSILMVKSINPAAKLKGPDELSGYNVFLAPNPVQSFVNVYLGAKKDEKFSLSLYDMNGKMIHTKKVSGFSFFTRFDMEHLASGVYLMSVLNHDGILIKAFKILKAN